MDRHALLALGLVVPLFVGGAVMLTSIDRRADAVVKVPNVAAVLHAGAQAPEPLPAPGPNSIFAEPPPPPLSAEKIPAPRTMCALLLTLPPRFNKGCEAEAR